MGVLNYLIGGEDQWIMEETDVLAITGVSKQAIRCLWITLKFF